MGWMWRLLSPPSSSPPGLHSLPVRAKTPLSCREAAFPIPFAFLSDLSAK